MAQPTTLRLSPPRPVRWRPSAVWDPDRNTTNNARHLLPIRLFCRLVPRRLNHLLALALGSVLAYAMTRTRRVVRHNLDRVARGRFPHRLAHRAVLRTFQNYARYLVDFMYLLGLDPRRVPGHIGHAAGAAVFDRLLAEGRGALLVTPHLGHWELGGALLAAEGYPVNVAGRATSDPWSRRVSVEMRQRLGLRFLELESGAGALTALPLIQALRRNEFVAMLLDRDSSQRICVVDFFDRKMIMPAGAAVLARITGAPLLPAYAVRDASGRYAAHHGRPIRPRDFAHLPRDEAIDAMTRAVARSFETIVARHYDQWYNFFPDWVEDRHDKE